MNYLDFKQRYIDTEVNFDGKYGNQCTDVYRQYCKELGVPQSPPVKGAKDIWTTYLPNYFNRFTYAKGDIPAQGDICIWDIGEFGHVALWDNGNQNNFQALGQNWQEGDGSGKLRIEYHPSYNHVLGWLRLKKEDSMISEDAQRALKILEQYKVDAQHGNLEGAISSLVGNAKDYKDLENKVNELTLKLTELESKLATVITEKNQYATLYNEEKSKPKTNIDDLPKWEAIGLLIKFLFKK